MVPMALGTQTGGSIIRPAAFNGVVGFKPSFGYVHRAGMTVLCDTLDTIGWFTREVELAIQVANVFLPAPPTQLPATSSLRRSDERRVGKECVSTCRSRRSRYH